MKDILQRLQRGLIESTILALRVDQIVVGRVEPYIRAFLDGGKV